MSHFAEGLRKVINQHCRENASNTPDFILSEYLFRCLDAFDAAVRERDHWHHFHPMPWTTHILEERTLDIKEGDQLRTTLPAQNAQSSTSGVACR